MNPSAAASNPDRRRGARDDSQPTIACPDDAGSKGPGGRPIRRYWPVAIASVLGLAGTLFVFGAMCSNDLRKLDAEIATRIESRVLIINNEIARYEDVVRAAEAYADAAGGSLDAQRFGAAASRLLDGREGIQALELVARVRSQARAAHEAEIRGAFYPDYRIAEHAPDGRKVPAGPRDEYFPVLGGAPSGDDEKARGFDIGSLRLPLLDEVRDAGRMLGTGAIRLSRWPSDGWGILVAAPLYATASVPAIEERRAALIGYVVGTFRVADMLDAIFRNATRLRGFDHYVFDGPTADPERLVYVHGSRLRPAGSVPPSYGEIADRRIVDRLQIAGREWTIVTVPLASVYSRAPGSDDWATLVVGLIATVLGSLYMRAIVRRNIQQQALADRLTAATSALRSEVDEHKSAEQRIEKMARYDDLTGLANRRVFMEAIEQAIARTRRGGKPFAVLYLDLDRFKDINDTLGHPVGDLLLISIAKRLQESVRNTDTVARFGGDEFAILMTDIGEPVDTAALADKLLLAVSRPVLLQGNLIRSGASIGIDVLGPDMPDAEILLSHADLALYRAKSEGRGTYRFFTDAMDAEVRARVALVAELREAIPAGQLFLAYQPQVDAGTGRIVGLEALVRWRHPRRGLVDPGEFVPVAETSGLMLALGRWVMREACRQMKAWLDAGIAPPLIAVNISGAQLKTPVELEADIAAILAESRLPAQRLEIELTETALMEASLEHNDTLLRLRESGLRIAIDDFGTGYSSLDYLGRFPVDRIKIAESFILDLNAKSGQTIVKAAISLAHELDIDVLVEGVETADQATLVTSWGCRQMQGFYFAEPMSAGEVADLLRAGTILRERPLHPEAAA